MSLVEAVLGTLMSYFVVLALTNNEEPGRYLALIGILCGATFACSALKIWGLNTYAWDSTFTRCTISWQNRGLFDLYPLHYFVVPPLP
jgi:hypothetical protein